VLTVEQATQRLRRCAECGRFLSSDAIDGLCTSCGETVHAAAANDTSHDTSHDTSNGPSAAPTSNGTSAAPSGTIADPTTSGTSPAGADADVDGAVAILIEAPIANVAPSRGASASLSTSAIRPRGVVILRPSQLHPDATSPIGVKAAEPLIEPLVRQRPVEVTPQPAVEPLPQPVSVPDRADDTDDWTIRIVVGVIIGILVGVAVPFLLSQ
jgi:hypothetical protein